MKPTTSKPTTSNSQKQWRQRGIRDVGASYWSQVAVSLSADGNVVAIGATWNDGINGTDSGHVRVFAWNSTSNNYVQRGADINGEAAGDRSGMSVSLSADGSVVAIGANYGTPRVYVWGN
jgi:hypothetical protein